MNCNETQTVLDSYLDGDLLPKEVQLFDEHIKNCVSCRDEVAEEKNTRELLSTMAYEPPSDDFEKRVFNNVRKHHASNGVLNKERKTFATGFISAIAASFVIWVATAVFFNTDKLAESQVISVAMNQVQTVRLMLDSENDVEQVTLTLGLPNNIRLKGYENDSQLVWKTSLNKGDNILALPIKAISHGQGNLIAKIQYGDRSKQFRILIKTFKDSVHGDVFFEIVKQAKFV